MTGHWGRCEPVTGENIATRQVQRPASTRLEGTRQLRHGRPEQRAAGEAGAAQEADPPPPDRYYTECPTHLTDRNNFTARELVPPNVPIPLRPRVKMLVKS